MDKKAIITIQWWCHCYIVCVGVKGDTGEPGARGPRGIVGKAHINHLYKDIIYQHNSCTRKQPACEYVKPYILLTTILLLLSEIKLVT